MARINRKRISEFYHRLREQAEFSWECLRRNPVYRQEYNELTATQDFQIYKHHLQLDMGYQAGEVSQFCTRWDLRLPKNPDEKFRPQTDGYLFDSGSVVSCRLHYWSIELKGAEDALAYVDRLVKKYNKSYAEAIELVREHSQQVHKNMLEWLEKTNRNEHTMVVDAAYPKEMIMYALFDNLWPTSTKQTKKKKLLHIPPNWRMMIRAWDLWQEGKRGVEIAKIIDAELSHEDVVDLRNISNWTRNIQRRIDKMKPKFPRPVW